MIGTFKNYIKFAAFVFRYGHLKYNEASFNQARQESLQGLQDFVPPDFKSPRSYPKKSKTQHILGQFAFIKKALRPTGGHLTAKEISYIRIAKSASTSISKEMLDKIYPDLKHRKITDTQINFLADVNTNIKTDGTSIFTVVRNPFSRLVSVYRDFFEKGAKDFIYHDYLFGVLPKNISFKEFVDRIADIPDRLKDQHFRPQHVVLKYYEKKKCTVEIFKLEESEILVQFLSKNAMQLPHLNKGAQYDYRAYYNTELLNKVHTLYAADIKRFGYEKTYEELLKHVKTVH